MIPMGAGTSAAEGDEGKSAPVHLKKSGKATRRRQRMSCTWKDEQAFSRQTSRETGTPAEEVASGKMQSHEKPPAPWELEQ